VREKQAGGVALVSRVTLDEYAAEWWERWLRGEDGTGRPENSVRNYKGALRRYVLPRLGHVRLDVLSPAVVARFRNGLQTEGKGAATVRYALAVLSAICTDAAEAGKVQANPVAPVKVPTARVQRERIALSATQVEALRNKMPTATDALLISLMAYAGLRPQEALALRVGDLRGTVLAVERAVAHGKIKPNKNERARGVDALTPLADDLAAFLKVRGAVTPAAWLFHNPQDASQPWSNTMYRNWRERTFKPTAEAVGIVGLRPYDLRRTFVSLLLACGVRRGEVADQAGHSLAVMEKHYAVTIAQYRGVALSDPTEVIRAARKEVAKSGAAPVLQPGDARTVARV